MNDVLLVRRVSVARVARWSEPHEERRTWSRSKLVRVPSYSNLEQVSNMYSCTLFEAARGTVCISEHTDFGLRTWPLPAGRKLRLIVCSRMARHKWAAN